MARLDYDDLFLNLAEQVKLPFVQILHEAELLRTNVEHPAVDASGQTITLASQAALQLIDGYLLSVQMRQQALELEQVSISSTLYDVASKLQVYARAHGCKLDLRIGGRYGPVMAHKQAVQAALTSLGYSFIEAATASTEDPEPIVTLAVRKNSQGISTGIFASHLGLSKHLFNHAKSFRGIVHQPLAPFDSGNGTGVFVADALLSGIDSPLKYSRFLGNHGLATTLPLSRQLQLI